MTDNTTIVRKCRCCLVDKEIENFWVYKKEAVTYHKSNCKDCEGKERCHTCKKIKSRDEFWNKRGLIDTVKCKDCWRSESKKVLRESLWI